MTARHDGDVPTMTTRATIVAIFRVVPTGARGIVTERESLTGQPD